MRYSRDEIIKNLWTCEVIMLPCLSFRAVFSFVGIVGMRIDRSYGCVVVSSLDVTATKVLLVYQASGDHW